MGETAVIDLAREALLTASDAQRSCIDHGRRHRPGRRLAPGRDASPRRDALLCAEIGGDTGCPERTVAVVDAAIDAVFDRAIHARAALVREFGMMALVFLVSCVSARLMPLTLLWPGIGGRLVPLRIRLALTIVLTFWIASLHITAVGNAPSELAGFALRIGYELLLGLGLALGFLVLLTGLQLAGSLIGQLAGLSLSDLGDPALVLGCIGRRSVLHSVDSGFAAGLGWAPTDRFAPCWPAFSWFRRAVDRPR